MIIYIFFKKIILFHWSRSRSRSHSVGLVLGLEKLFGLVLVLTPLASFSFSFSQHSGLINIPDCNSVACSDTFTAFLILKLTEMKINIVPFCVVLMTKLCIALPKATVDMHVHTWIRISIGSLRP